MAYDPEYHKKYREANKQKAKEYARIYYQKNRETIEACRKQYVEDNYQKVSDAKKNCYLRKRSEYISRIKNNARINKEKISRYQAAYRKANRAYFNAYANLRNTRTKAATPAWADYEKMASIYENSARLTKETGIPHQVDHIVPVTSDVVCGLNWEGNLQILTATENRQKKNVMWPDMP
jgi:hypothetical protein